ncbi:MAG: metallophosphoesterase [Clostridia bacterium]|nr:metallophosphoesterase [Clostridia bacterium]
MTKKTIFAVSDIHGHYTQLKTALDRAGYCADDPSHLLVCCGDYFDRGSENLRVLKFFDFLDRKVLLRGNHEDMLLNLFRTGQLMPYHCTNGTVATVLEFFGKYSVDGFDWIDFSGRTRMLDRVTDFIHGTHNYFETEHYVFTHGWLPTTLSASGPMIDPAWRRASPERWIAARRARWTEMYPQCGRLPDRTLVCGHVPTCFAAELYPERRPEDFSILRKDGLIVLDAGTFSSGEVNVLVIPDEPCPT